jgi:HEPN domain-containing protein
MREEIELIKRRSRSFLENAKYLLETEVYDLAAFNAEQAAQLYLKALLLELSGDYPRTHSIIRLLNELKAVNRREVEVFIRKNRSNLHSLEDAYITSRYFVKTFEKEDGEYLVKQAEKVIRFGEKLKRLLGKGKNR